MKLPSKVHPSWANCSAWSHLPAIIRNLIKGTFAPPNIKDAFNVFSMPTDEVKVIILGMAPYHTYDKKGEWYANGHAFACAQEQLPYEAYPPSLKLIADAICVDEQNYKRFDHRLGPWIDDGVLLLNAALTCVTSDPKSHLSIWNKFMSEILAFITEKQGGCIVYFMGNDAKKFRGSIDPFQNKVFESYHPAYWARNSKPFKDNKFKEVAQEYYLMYGEQLHYLLPF